MLWNMRGSLVLSKARNSPDDFSMIYCHPTAEANIYHLLCGSLWLSKPITLPHVMPFPRCGDWGVATELAQSQLVTNDGAKIQPGPPGPVLLKQLCQTALTISIQMVTGVNLSPFLSFLPSLPLHQIPYYLSFIHTWKKTLTSHRKGPRLRKLKKKKTHTKNRQTPFFSLHPAE